MDLDTKTTRGIIFLVVVISIVGVFIFTEYLSISTVQKKQSELGVSFTAPPKSQMTVANVQQKNKDTSAMPTSAFNFKPGIKMPPSITVGSNAYIKGQVSSVNLVNNTLLYRPYTSGVLDTAIKSVKYPNSIEVYRVASDAQVSNIQARMPATIGEIKSGQSFFIAVDRKNFSGNVVTPLFFVLVSK